MPNAAVLENQRKRRSDEPQCESRGCWNLVYIVIEDKTGRLHRSCYGHMDQLARKYSGPNDCLMVIQ